MSCGSRPRVMHYSSRRPEALYRSNSSLELEHHHAPGGGIGGVGGGGGGGGGAGNLGGGGATELRREYGSQGSIDLMGAAPAPADSFFAMLQDYRPTAPGGVDQRSPGPAEYLRGTVAPPPASENASNSLVEDGLGPGAAATSPKLRHKLHRFWVGPGAAGSTKPPRHQTVDDSVVNTNNCMAAPSDPSDERQRRRSFAHYDCQSLSANLGYAVKRRGLLLARRRNTATGASAASMLAARSATPEGADSGDEDAGDGRGNDLIDSCPFFRNEMGGEVERMVSLGRCQPPPAQPSGHGCRQLHRPPLAYGVSVLEYPPGETHWQHGSCPHQRNPHRAIETVDRGANYYRKHFYGQDHHNWFGLDDNLGPVAVSIRRERLPEGNGNTSQAYQYRLLIRTSELLTLRGAVLEDAIPNLKLSNSNKGLNTKEVLEYVAPEIQLPCLRLGVGSAQTEEQLLKLDEQGLTSHYKVGVLYCRAGQGTEEEMYNNEESGPALLDFLDAIGQRVRLRGFDKYRAGLDNKTDSTGLYSVYAQYQDCEIMFHVSTLLPFTPNNRQQLLRKRHIGNDIVTIVFQEPGAQPFTPKNIRSQFQHVFVVVQVADPCTENTRYSVAVSRSKEVPVFGPPIHEGATFAKSKAFSDFLLAKVINAENAAHRSEKFATMATRTRQEYLKDLATNYTTTTLVDTGQKFSMLSFSSKKKDRLRPRPVVPRLSQRGALCWGVVLDDSGQGGKLVDCLLGVSADSLVLVEEASREIVFVSPTKSVLGWALQATCLRIYHHQGECVTLHLRDASEGPEACGRLRDVTPGSAAREMVLRRNTMGQLGFHVQPDGVVTQVENMGQACQAGLVQGDRLVEICKVAVCTLSHDQMVDLLKTSATVTATVIAPSPDGTPKRGCSVSCWRNGGGPCEGDYENVTNPAQAVQQQLVVAPLRRTRHHERSFSPSGSSGYGSGGRAALIADCTPTSSSSGHSSDDPWYEALDGSEMKPQESPPPPPLPARVGSAFQPVPPSPRPQDFKLGDKVMCLMPPLQARMVAGGKAASLPPECAAGRAVASTDGHSTDTSSASERLFGMPSEDELSTGSNNVSPRLRRAKLTPGSGSSRNQSPRDTGEARLRPGVTPRSANRGSANLGASTLQEDLMRLINPDYIPDAAVHNRTPEPLGKVRSSSGGSSRENLPACAGGSSGGDSGSPVAAAAAATAASPDRCGGGGGGGEVILTTARPATVISNASTASSPAPSGKELDRLSPRATKCHIPLPDAGDMDWPSLVDTATRAMLHDPARPAADWADQVADRLSLDNVGAVANRPGDVRNHLAQLEGRVARETRRRLSLEEEVRRLREENRRLQEESQAAAQQLRRFTEWFFQTIDRQQ